MKRGIILSLFVIILQCISFNSFAQDKKSEKREKIAEQEKMVKELLRNTDKTGEAFDFRITIYFSGSSTISVTPSLREFISYHGTITNIK